MREKLTIGELAALLDTSTFNIRYYEKEGLVKPAEVSDNGYRLYDYEQLLALNMVILLRDSNVPIKKVKTLLEDFQFRNYKEALESSFTSVVEEIDRLVQLKKEIQLRLNSLNHFEEHASTFEVKKYMERTIYHLNVSDYDTRIDIKALYDLYANNQLDMKGIYKKDDYYILQETQAIHGLIDKKDRYSMPKTIFPKGQYLCYSFEVKDEAEYEDHIYKFMIYMEQQNMPYNSEVLLRIDPVTVILGSKTYMAEIQVLIS